MATVTQAIRYEYKDLNTGYALDTKGLQLTGNDAVINGLINLINTPIGSVYFAPTYGSTAANMLFDNLSNRSFKSLTTLSREIAKWCPAITLNIAQSSIETLTPSTVYMKLVISISGATPQTLGLTVSQ